MSTPNKKTTILAKDSQYYSPQNEDAGDDICVEETQIIKICSKETHRWTNGYYFARTRGIKEILYSDIEGGEPSEEWKVPSFISKEIVDVNICNWKQK